MATLLGDHNVRGVSNVDLRVNNGIDKITLNSNITSVTLTNRSTRVCAVEATVSSDANPATIVLPTVNTLPSGKEWSWTGLFFDSTVPVKIISESSTLLFTAFPNDVVEVMWVASENNWKIVSHLKDEKKERLTGMLYPIGTDTVELTIDASTNKQYLVISDRVLFFNYGDGSTKRVFFKETVVEVPATASGNTEPTYVSINDAGTVLFDNTPITMATRDRSLIARGIRVKINNIWNLTNFKYMPYLADTDSLLRSAALVEHKFCVFPKTGTTNARVRFTDFDLVQEGINYENSTLNPDRLHVAAADPGVFYTFYPNTMSLTSSSEVDGNVYYNTTSSTTTSVPADKFTIQVLLSSPKGEIWRLYGQELFNSIEEATEAALGSNWDVTGLPTDGVAAAAFVIKGDQYSGSSTLDLTNRQNFTICAIPQQLLSEGSAGGSSAPMVSGNTILQENVVVGEEASVKNFNFKSHVPVTVSGDTVTISVNGVTNSNTSNVASPVIHTWTGTQDEYDAISTYDANTIYNIVDSETSLANQYHQPLLSFMWSDHLLNDVRWLRADTFSWQDGGVYSAVYNHLSNEITVSNAELVYNPNLDIVVNQGVTSIPYVKAERNSNYDYIENGITYYAWAYGDTTNSFGLLTDGWFFTSETPQANDMAYIADPLATEAGVVGTAWTVGVNTKINCDTYITNNVYIPVIYYTADDGHKICLLSQEISLMNIYSEIGIAWYFLLDTANQRFKLPRTKWGFTGLLGNSGDYISQQIRLPNITGTVPLGRSNSSLVTGAFYATSASDTTSNSGGSNDTYLGVLDASRSSSIYSGNDSNVYVRQRSTQMYLYFFVGHFTTSAIEQTAGLNSELFNGKVDLNAANLSDDGKSLIAGLGMPSTTRIPLTLGASGSSYIAPANGYFFLQKAIADTQFINLAIPDIMSITETSSGSQIPGIFIPVLKGQTVIASYTGTGQVYLFQFIYAEGSKSEAN